MFVNELFESDTVMNTLVVYPGRFQPWHKGHKAVYDYLVKNYGRDNVFIATSNKVDPPRSPFTFSEKAQFMNLTGVSSDRIIETRDPYRSIELVQNYDPATTRLIFAVSEKDMSDDPRFSFKTKKDGSPSYLQPMPKNVGDMVPFQQHGYIMTVPTFNFSVLGQPMRSATEVRAQFAQADEETQRQIVTDLFGSYDNNVHDIMRIGLIMTEDTNTLSVGTTLNLVKNYGNFNTLTGVVKSVTPSGKLKIQITKAEPVPGKKGAVKVGDIVTMAQNYVKRNAVNEATDPKFVGFMNKALGDKADPAKPAANMPAEYSNFEIMSFDNMPGYRPAFKFGMSVLKAMDQTTRTHFINSPDDDLIVYMLNIAEKKGFVPKYFVEEDLDEVTQWFDEIFADPSLESWTDLLKSMPGKPGIAEGDVIPFKRPSQALTWQQVPRDILLLANDWFWASEDNSGLAATIDPEGFGNGTANDVKYLTAKLQQKGWTIDFNDEYDAPGEFNLRLTNKRGQSVLLSIEDAQSFTGWAKGTSQYDLEESFDKPYKLLRWEKGDFGDVDAIARLDDGTFLSIMFTKGFDQETKEEAWSVEFWRNDSQEVTGDGDSQRVFATVLNAIQTFIKKYKPNRVYFAAMKEVGPGVIKVQNRASLYDRLVQRYAKAWGFKAFRADTGNKVMYELNRIKSPVTKDLKEFSPGQGGSSEDDDPYRYPKPEHYARSVDFFGQFEAEHFDKEEMNDATGEFKGYWYYGNELKQIAYFKFDNPKRTGSNHPGMGWYYEPQNESVSKTGSNLKEFAPIKPPTAGAYGGNKDYGQPTSSRYLGNNKFVLGTTNNYVLTATVDKWGLEWDEDDEIWFLDSPGAVYIADATEGEIELPSPQEQRNQIHDLVSDYLNARNSAELQRVAAYYGHSADGEMATNEAMNEFAPPGSNDSDPDEYEILRKLAAQWWHGTEQEMIGAQKTLATMGWEIGQDESGDEDAGVFVVAAGDIHGDTYTAFGHTELEQVYRGLNEIVNMPPVKKRMDIQSLYNDVQTRIRYHQASQLTPIDFPVANHVFRDGQDSLKFFLLNKENKPVFYLGISKFHDGYKTGAVAGDAEVQGQGFGWKLYKAVSEYLGIPLYSDSTQTADSKTAIWQRLINNFPNQVVGYDQVSRKNVPLNTDIYQTLPKDQLKDVDDTARRNTLLLKFLPTAIKEDAAGVGVVASKKQKNDPRYKTSLTVDVHPDTPKKNMRALRLI